MIAPICIILLPPIWLALLLLRLLMPRLFLFAAPAEPFRPNLWHVMILIAAVGIDYVIMTPDLHRGPTRSGMTMFLGDVVYLPLVFFAGWNRRPTLLRWMVVAFAISLPIEITTLILNRYLLR